MVDYKELAAWVGIILSYVPLFMYLPVWIMLVLNIPLVAGIILFRTKGSDINKKITKYLPMLYAAGAIVKLFSSAFTGRLSLKLISIVIGGFLYYYYNEFIAEDNHFKTKQDKFIFISQLMALLVLVYISIGISLRHVNIVRSVSE